MTALADPPVYRVGDPDPLRAAYASTGAAVWDACLDTGPSTGPFTTQLCCWPRTHPHRQHISVLAGRITAVWE